MSEERDENKARVTRWVTLALLMKEERAFAPEASCLPKKEPKRKPRILRAEAVEWLGGG